MFRMRGNISPFLALTLGVLVMAAACKKEPAPPPEAPAAKAEAKSQADEAKEAKRPGPASLSGQSLAECIAPFSNEGEKSEVSIGGKTATRQGTVLSFADEGEKVVFGVVANFKEDTPGNQVNLTRYVDYFKAQKVDAVLVPGDVAQEKDQMVSLLAALAKVEVPVLVIPGNHEPRDEYRAAIDELAGSNPNVVDMTQTRLARFGAAAVTSLPGYYDPRFFHDEERACQYFKEDVEGLADIAEAAAQPVVLLAHAEPQGKGPEAIDAIVDGNAGDANLSALLREVEIPFGVFANIQEAGGKATDIDSKPIAPSTPSKSLLLNPGVGDSIAWSLNDGSVSHGMAAVLTVESGSASYEVYRAKELKEEDLAGKAAATE